MPIYEFQCEKCEKDSEVLVRSSTWKGARCPHCGSARLAKKFSVFASSGGGASEAPACESGSRSCGCHCTGGKHKH
ncbi:MAG TPA: zinc ribbon domain-containing protein [Candidatus Binatia bacterium]|nr:zinc ribbon domain-containing protein [Candidatus Binatia bacterium]